MSSGAASAEGKGYVSDRRRRRADIECLAIASPSGAATLKKLCVGR
jgi:hypothetical protein